MYALIILTIKIKKIDDNKYLKLENDNVNIFLLPHQTNIINTIISEINVVNAAPTCDHL